MTKSNLALQDRKDSSIIVVWRLDFIMRKYKINNTALAATLVRTPASICKLKYNTTMPRINSKYVNDLIVALNYLRMKQIRESKSDIVSLKEFLIPITFEDLIKIEKQFPVS